METKEINRSVVVVSDIPPVQVNRHWLVQNQIFQDAEILDQSLFSEIVTNIITNDAVLVVLQNQLQLTTKRNFEEGINKVIKILELFPNSSYSAAGINLNFILQSSNSHTTAKRLFANFQEPLFRDYFGSDDSAFGSYLSTNYEESRLRLTVLPAKKAVDSSGKDLIDEEGLHCAYNFQFNSTDSNSIINFFRDWKKYCDHASLISNSIQ